VGGAGEGVSGGWAGPQVWPGSIIMLQCQQTSAWGEGGRGKGGGQSRVGYVTEEEGGGEAKWQRREAEEKQSGRGGRQRRG